MTTTAQGAATAGNPDAAASLLVKAGRFFHAGTVAEDLRTVTLEGGRGAEVFYRDRWSNGRIVRSTHGVN